MTDADKDISDLSPIDKWEDFALRKPGLIDELHALLVTARGIQKRHAHEIERTKVVLIRSGVVHTLTTDINGIVEYIEEAINTYEMADVHPIR